METQYETFDTEESIVKMRGWLIMGHRTSHDIEEQIILASMLGDLNRSDREIQEPKKRQEFFAMVYEELTPLFEQ